MLVQADFSKLELVVVAWLAQDPVMMDELIRGIDIHETNRRTFNLDDRRTAKILVFRIVYGGTEFAFAQDPDFYVDGTIKEKQQFWKERIDEFYNKYAGIKKWHEDIFETVQRTGQYVSPTGRIFSFRPKEREVKVGHQYYNPKPSFYWPLPDIKNYPVQGTAADLVSIARVTAYKRLKNLPDVKYISTVHDSLVVDCKKYQVDTVARILLEEIEAVPGNFETVFKSKFSPLTLTAELKVGPTLGELEKYKW